MILIDIEMPEKCGSCPCFHAENPMYCQLIKPPDKNKRIVAPYGLPRPEWCPLKEQEATVKQWTKEIADYQLAHAPDSHDEGEKYQYKKGIWDGLQIAWNIISEGR